jgi:DNA-binding LacI/PurR family transcriptional regulator
MELSDPPDCVICFDIFHGINFKRYATDLGLSVPKDVGLLVFSMDKFNAAADISGIQFDFRGIGSALAHMIIKRMENGRDQKSMLFPGKFIDEVDGVKLNSLKTIG